LAAPPDPGADRLRIDKWLWHARFFKTRSLAADIVSRGRLRRNGARITKPGTAIMPGDTLTFPQGAQIRVVRIVAIGARRGPAAEAQALYHDLAPSPENGGGACLE
jgi:ribosome-associated heat shock protein Hsp15